MHTIDPITDEQIAARAYQRFLERGGQHGHHVEDWLAAREDLLLHSTRYEVVLVDAGARVIEVVRRLRELTGMDLRQVKEVIDALPGTVKRAASSVEAEAFRQRLESLGARVEVRAIG